MNDNALDFKRWEGRDLHPGSVKKNAAAGGTTFYSPFHLITASSAVLAEALGVEVLQIVTSSDQVLLVLCIPSFTSWVLRWLAKPQSIRGVSRLLL